MYKHTSGSLVHASTSNSDDPIPHEVAVSDTIVITPVDHSVLDTVKMPVKFVKCGRPKGSVKSLNVRFGTKSKSTKDTGSSKRKQGKKGDAASDGCDASKDNCVECGMADPPAEKSGEETVRWILCDNCNYWYHMCCLDNPPKSTRACYICERCLGV